MAVLNDLARSARTAAKAVTDAAVRAFGIPEPTPEVDRLVQLQMTVNEASASLQSAADDLELAYLELEEGAPNRIALAEEVLHAAEQVRERCQRSLTAQQVMRERREADAGKSARAESWKVAERLVRQRVAAAGKLGEALRTAGEHYKALVDLGLEAYSAIPQTARWPGGPASYGLAVANVAGTVGVDLLRAGLPDAVQVSPSMLDQYPSIGFPPVSRTLC